MGNTARDESSVAAYPKQRVTVNPGYLDYLQGSRDWWKSEWEHKDREAEWLWRAVLALGVLCGVAFFVGTVVG